MPGFAARHYFYSRSSFLFIVISSEVIHISSEAMTISSEEKAISSELIRITSEEKPINSIKKERITKTRKKRAKID